MTDEFQAGRYTVGVIYLDNHLLAVEKPCNMPVQADRSGDTDLLSACKNYIGKKFAKPGNVYLGLVHRLDRPVGGAMVFARTSKAAARLCEQFAKHAADKKYLAVTSYREGTAILDDWLYKDESTGTVSVVEAAVESAKEARLETRAIATQNGLTLGEVTLFTGRAHQIRVQHAHAGWPLWGDARYGGGKPGEQIALWAAKLTVEHPTMKTAVTFCSRPPQTGVWTLFKKELDEYYGR